MKSAEVYAVLRNALAPTFKAMGFKRGKSFLSWSRDHGGQYTVVWCQVSRDGWDEYAGSQFVVEFQRSADSDVGTPSTRRKRISKLLSDAERADVQILQNTVLSSLQRPPANHFLLNASPDVRNWYLKKFEIDAELNTDTRDIWFRYGTPDHVKAWAMFLDTVMPRCILSIEQDN